MAVAVAVAVTGSEQQLGAVPLEEPSAPSHFATSREWQQGRWSNYGSGLGLSAAVGLGFVKANLPINPSFADRPDEERGIEMPAEAEDAAQLLQTVAVVQPHPGTEVVPLALDVGLGTPPSAS